MTSSSWKHCSLRSRSHTHELLLRLLVLLASLALASCDAALIPALAPPTPPLLPPPPLQPPVAPPPVAPPPPFSPASTPTAPPSTSPTTPTTAAPTSSSTPPPVYDWQAQIPDWRERVPRYPKYGRADDESIPYFNCSALHFVYHIHDWISEVLGEVLPLESFKFDHEEVDIGELGAWTAGWEESEAQCGEFTDDYVESCGDLVMTLAQVGWKGLAEYLTSLMDSFNAEEVGDNVRQSHRFGWHPVFRYAKEIVDHPLFASADPTKVNPRIEVGGGSGAGFQIICNGTVLATAGGGGGGGLEGNLHTDFSAGGGGGGGVQVNLEALGLDGGRSNETSWSSVGGGSGCGSCQPDLICPQSRFLCGTVSDTLLGTAAVPGLVPLTGEEVGEVGLELVSYQLKEAIRECRDDSGEGLLTVYGGGGGGGGTAECCTPYMFGYGFSFVLGRPIDFQSDGKGQEGEGQQWGEDVYAAGHAGGGGGGAAAGQAAAGEGGGEEGGGEAEGGEDAGADKTGVGDKMRDKWQGMGNGNGNGGAGAQAAPVANNNGGHRLHGSSFGNDWMHYMPATGVGATAAGAAAAAGGGAAAAAAGGARLLDDATTAAWEMDLEVSEAEARAEDGSEDEEQWLWGTGTGTGTLEDVSGAFEDLLYDYGDGYDEGERMYAQKTEIGQQKRRTDTHDAVQRLVEEVSVPGGPADSSYSYSNKTGTDTYIESSSSNNNNNNNNSSNNNNNNNNSTESDDEIAKADWKAVKAKAGGCETEGNSTVCGAKKEQYKWDRVGYLLHNASLACSGSWDDWCCVCTEAKRIRRETNCCNGWSFVFLDHEICCPASDANKTAEGTQYAAGYGGANGTQSASKAPSDSHPWSVEDNRGRFNFEPLNAVPRLIKRWLQKEADRGIGAAAGGDGGDNNGTYIADAAADVDDEYASGGGSGDRVSGNATTTAMGGRAFNDEHVMCVLMERAVQPRTKGSSGGGGLGGGGDDENASIEEEPLPVPLDEPDDHNNPGAEAEAAAHVPFIPSSVPHHDGDDENEDDDGHDDDDADGVDNGDDGDDGMGDDSQPFAVSTVAATVPPSTTTSPTLSVSAAPTAAPSPADLLMLGPFSGHNHAVVTGPAVSEGNIIAGGTPEVASQGREKGKTEDAVKEQGREEGIFVEASSTPTPKPAPAAVVSASPLDQATAADMMQMMAAVSENQVGIVGGGGGGGEEEGGRGGGEGEDGSKQVLGSRSDNSDNVVKGFVDERWHLQPSEAIVSVRTPPAAAASSAMFATEEGLEVYNDADADVEEKGGKEEQSLYVLKDGVDENEEKKEGAQEGSGRAGGGGAGVGMLGLGGQEAQQKSKGERGGPGQRQQERGRGSNNDDYGKEGSKGTAVLRGMTQALGAVFIVALVTGVVVVFSVLLRRLPMPIVIVGTAADEDEEEEEEEEEEEAVGKRKKSRKHRGGEQRGKGARSGTLGAAAATGDVVDSSLLHGRASMKLESEEDYEHDDVRGSLISQASSNNSGYGALEDGVRGAMRTWAFENANAAEAVTLANEGDVEDCKGYQDDDDDDDY